MTQYVFKIFLCFIFFPTMHASTFLKHIDHIEIKKHERIMNVYYKNKLLKSYKIALGGSPIGPKKQEGDQKTPEGKYKVSFKNPKSAFHLSLKVSYPNAHDRKAAAKKGVNPGDNIMIHGLGKNFGHLGKQHFLNDWTLGCIAVTDEEITEVYKASSLTTTIEIKP